MESPVSLYKAIDKKHPEWLEWEPETVLQTLDRDDDKVLAVQTVARNPNKVTKDHFPFEKVIMAFCDNQPIMGTYDKPHLEEIMYGVQQIKEIIKASQEGLHDGDIDFTGDVPSYVAAVAKDRGWFVLPERLNFAQQALNHVRGLTEESPIYKAHKKIRDEVEKDPEAHIDSDDQTVVRYVGAYLFNPHA